MTTGNRRNTPHRLFCLCLLVLLLASGEEAYAQSGIRGLVKDSSNEPLVGAFVSLYDGDAMKGYAICGSEGEFSIAGVNPGSEWRLIVSCLGYRTAELPLSTFLKTSLIVMKKQDLVLKEASVTARVVEQKGDTIAFTAGAFKDGTERSLADLLEKLPGITVSATGGIYHNGRAINKFYIEGMDLVGSGYGVVTKTLSPEIVAEVEVFQRHQPIKVLAGQSQSDRSAVNIILKENAKNTWMMSADALAGAPEFPLFDVSSNISRFSKDRQDMYVLKGNDIGVDIKGELTEQSYFGKTGAFLVSDSNLDVDFIGRLNPSRTILPAPKEYWYDNTAGMGSFNHLKKVDDNTQVRASLNVATEKYGESSLSSELISFADGTSMSIDERRSMNESFLYLSGSAMLERNTDLFFLSNDFSMEGQLKGTVSDLHSQSKGLYGQEYSLPSVKIQNSLDYRAKTRRGRVASVTSTSKYFHNAQSAHYSGPSMDIIQNYGESYFGSENSLSSSARVGRVMLNYAAGLSVEYMDLTTSLEGESSLPSVAEEKTGILSITPMTRFSGRFMLGRAEMLLSMPAYLHAVTGSGTISSQVYPTVSPTISVSRRFSQSFRVNVGSSYSLSRSGLKSLLPVPVMTNYRTISKSDSLALHGTFKAYSNFEFSDLARLMSATLSTSVSAFHSDRIPVATYDDSYTFSSFTPAPMYSRAYSVNGKVDKYFGVKSFVIELSGGWTRSDQSHFLQDMLCSYTVDEYNSQLSLRLAPVTWFASEARVIYDYSVTGGDASTDSHSVTFNGMMMVKPYRDIMLVLDAFWLEERVPGIVSSNLPLLKTELTWKLSKVTLVASCRNILDITGYSRQFVSAYKTTSFSMDLPGRQFLLGFRMSI